MISKSRRARTDARSARASAPPGRPDPNGVPTMRRFIVGVFAVIGAFVSVIIAALVALAIWGSSGTTPVAEATVLNLDLTEALADTAPREGLAAVFADQKPTLRDVLDAIERAGN